jgi:hypothetical protein
MQNKPENNDQKPENDSALKDKAGFYFSSMIKITDPNTNEVLVQQRGDD